MTAALKTLVIVLIVLFIVAVCFKLAIKRMLSNIHFFANFSNAFYDYFYSLKKIRHLRTNNFGYAPVDEDITSYGPDLQYGLQLYKELVSSKGNDVIAEGVIIAEISCGKGGGAAYLIQKLKPAKYIGIDFSRKAIEFCTNSYTSVGNTQFICANADKLPLLNDSVDIVINVEASHLYRNIDQFFSEVYRVLKTDGRFLFTDYRCIEEYPVEKLESELRMAGFTVVDKRVVTPQIHLACIEASGRRAQLVREAIPWYLRKAFRHYAVLNGTKKFDMLANGKIEYLMYRLAKTNLVYLFIFICIIAG